eukprot:EG_transcript_15007
MQRAALLVAAPLTAGLLYGGWHYAFDRAASPFVYPALTETLERRKVQEQAIRRLMQLHQEKSQLIRQRAARFEHHGRLAYQLEDELAALEAETKKGIEHILYGTEPGTHRRYVKRYGCAKWTDSALGHLAAHAPLIEIGAGRGLWARELRKRGVDILAFDDMSNVPMPEYGFLTPVLKGDQEEVRRYPDRTLFLCYPPPGGMARDCLFQYRGQRFLYVGEGRGGVNAAPDFFDLLEHQWTVQLAEDLDPFPGGCERFWVLERKS